MGVTAILDHVTQMWRTNFVPPAPRGSIWNLALIGQVGLLVSEKIFKKFFPNMSLYKTSDYWSMSIFFTPGI